MKTIFHFCSYWGTWSRVLSYDDGYFVELNLTPVSQGYHYDHDHPEVRDSEGTKRDAERTRRDWDERVKGIRIRRHFTARGSNDRDVDELPEHVRGQMVKYLGEELTERLLTEDFLPQVDWDLFKKHCNAGANLADIRCAA